MKNFSKLFIYFFALAVLYIIFQQVNAKKKFAADELKMEKLKSKVEVLKVEKDSLENEALELSYFDIRFDDYAREYWEDQGYTVVQIESLVMDTLIESNDAEEDNPLVPLVGMEGTMKVDRVKLLNHKWAIADITDGVYWGQVLYSYNFSENKTLSLDVITSVLYSVR